MYKVNSIQQSHIREYITKSSEISYTIGILQYLYDNSDLYIKTIYVLVPGLDHVPENIRDNFVLGTTSKRLDVTEDEQFIYAGFEVPEDITDSSNRNMKRYNVDGSLNSRYIFGIAEETFGKRMERHDPQGNITGIFYEVYANKIGEFISFVDNSLEMNISDLNKLQSLLESVDPYGPEEILYFGYKDTDQYSIYIYG